MRSRVERTTRPSARRARAPTGSTATASKGSGWGLARLKADAGGAMMVLTGPSANSSAAMHASARPCRPTMTSSWSRACRAARRAGAERDTPDAGLAGAATGRGQSGEGGLRRVGQREAGGVGGADDGHGTLQVKCSIEVFNLSRAYARAAVKPGLPSVAWPRQPARRAVDPAPACERDVTRAMAAPIRGHGRRPRMRSVRAARPPSVSQPGRWQRRDPGTPPAAPVVQ